MTTGCPKCGYHRRPEDTAPDYECPECGIVYAKFLARQRRDEEAAAVAAAAASTAPVVDESRASKPESKKQPTRITFKTSIKVIIAVAISWQFLSLFSGSDHASNSSGSQKQATAKPAKIQKQFVESQFHWDQGTDKYRYIVISGVNKVYRENERCDSLDPATASLSKTKSTPGNPAFFVTCTSGKEVFNVYFTKSEVESNKTLTARAHADQVSAVRACEDYAKSQASHPSTVSFSRFMDLAVLEKADGRTIISSSFTAKNGFNLELKYKIICVIDSNELVSANIAEYR